MPQPTLLQTRAYSELLRGTVVCILEDAGNPWMFTADIAHHINVRNLCPRYDGLPITALHIGRQTRNYSRIFERSGRRVRLRHAELE